MPRLFDLSRLMLLLGPGLTTIVFMGWWGMQVSEGTVGDQGVLGHAPGETIVLSLLRVISIDGPSSYTVGQGSLVVPIEGPTGRLAVGAEVTIGGVVQEGSVRASFVQTAPGRPKKRALGLVGLALGGALFAASVRPSAGGLRIYGLG